jgi:hypothetical protein
VESISARFEADLNALDQAFDKNPYAPRLHEQLEQVCQLYLTVRSGDQETLRAYVGQRRALQRALEVHVGWCAREVKSAYDRDLVRGALAAISLGDNSCDYRDNYTALGALYLSAARNGIDVSSDFYQIGMISSSAPGRGGGSLSTQEFLTTFEQSAYFAADVAPKLNSRT